MWAFSRQRCYLCGTGLIPPTKVVGFLLKLLKEGRGLNDNVLKDTFLQEYHTTEELREHFKNKAAD